MKPRDRSDLIMQLIVVPKWYHGNSAGNDRCRGGSEGEIEEEVHLCRLIPVTTWLTTPVALLGS